MSFTPETVTPLAVARAGDRRIWEIRNKFHAFRRYIRPQMHWNWWTMKVAVELQQFYEDLVAGRRPKMAIQAPPQHGKSWTIEDFIAWVAGTNPELKTIFASYSDELGERTNINLQRTLRSNAYQLIFPRTQIGHHGWVCNNSMIEYCYHTGSFRNVTIDGAINGMELNLGVIDDPHKGRAEAMSKVARDRVWNWFADDWSPRFAAHSAMLIVMTRWHVDDLLGRYLERFPDMRMVCFPAIAEEDEYIDGNLVRRKGAPLFPAVKPLTFLEERRRLMSEASWQSEYQQHPFIVGGGIFPIDKLRITPTFDRTQVRASVRYWDKAGTAGGGAHTAGVLMHAMKNNTFVIGHVERGQWSAMERENTIKAVADMDRQTIKGPYEVIVEQEPGSGGKESAEATIRNLRGHRVFADHVTGSKEVRAEPLAAQVQGNNVWLVAGAWVQAFVDEAESWPHGKYRDQIDAAAGAFARLTGKPPYNLDALAT